MFETEPKSQPKDRKLGDEWAEWDGDIYSGDQEVNEKLTTFFLLSICSILIFALAFSVSWYLIKPRIELFSPLASNLIEWSLSGLAIVFFVAVIVESISLLKFERSLFPYRLTEKFLLFLLPKTVWLGAKFGISRDRVGNSFIKMHNYITRTYAEKLPLDTVLILLPRCLKRDMRRQIMDIVNGDNFKISTAGGGEEARKAIKQFRPSFILALACERDLMSGIKDVAKKIPVIALPNKRPEGPCKNTHISLEDFKEAIEYIRKNLRHNGEKIIT